MTAAPDPEDGHNNFSFKLNREGIWINAKGWGLLIAFAALLLLNYWLSNGFALWHMPKA
jgi:hypothetical protein